MCIGAVKSVVKCQHLNPYKTSPILVIQVKGQLFGGICDLSLSGSPVEGSRMKREVEKIDSLTADTT